MNTYLKYYIMLTGLMLIHRVQAQVVSKEIVEEECILYTRHGNELPRKRDKNNVHFLTDWPKFQLVGRPRKKTLLTSLIPDYLGDNLNYMKSNKFFFFVENAHDINNFYEQFEIDRLKDSITTCIKSEDKDQFQRKLEEHSRNIFYLKDLNFSFEFIVVRGKWLKYTVREKPEIFYPLVEREYKSDQYEVYFLQEMHEIYSIGSIISDKIQSFPKTDYY